MDDETLRDNILSRNTNISSLFTLILLQCITNIYILLFFKQVMVLM